MAFAKSDFGKAGGTPVLCSNASRKRRKFRFCVEFNKVVRRRERKAPLINEKGEIEDLPLDLDVENNLAGDVAYEKMEVVVLARSFGAAVNYLNNALGMVDDGVDDGSNVNMEDQSTDLQIDEEIDLDQFLEHMQQRAANDDVYSPRP